MATRSQVLKRVKELNVQFDDTGDSFSVDAPRGEVFVSTGLHCMVSVYQTPWENGTDKKWAWDDLFDRLSDGLEDCDEVDCDICNEE